MSEAEAEILADRGARHTRDVYAPVAPVYDLWARLTESRAAQKALQLAALRDGERVLEVAVGTGLVFEQLVARNPSGTTVGLDLSPGMLRRAVRRATRGHAVRVVLLRGSAFSLPCKSHSFDLVVSNFMFDLLPEPRFLPTLLEFKRVLRRPGRVVVSTMSLGPSRGNRFWAWLARRFPALLTGCRPISLRPYLEQAGFSHIESFAISQNTFPSEVIRAALP